MGNQQVLHAGTKGDAEIPIARFGRSNIGQMKEVYRLDKAAIVTAG